MTIISISTPLHRHNCYYLYLYQYDPSLCRSLKSLSVPFSFPFSYPLQSYSFTDKPSVYSDKNQIHLNDVTQIPHLRSFYFPLHP